MERTRRLHAPKGPFTTIGSKVKGKLHDIEEIVADNLGIEQIIPEDMAPFANLQALYIPNNKLQILNNLQLNYRLYLIDARYNRLRDVNLPEQRYLRELYLSHNKLESLETFIPKLVHMRELQVLDLRENPLALEKGYRNLVTTQIPTLLVLDGLPITRTPLLRNLSQSQPLNRPGTSTKNPLESLSVSSIKSQPESRSVPSMKSDSQVGPDSSTKGEAEAAQDPSTKGESESGTDSAAKGEGETRTEPEVMPQSPPLTASASSREAQAKARQRPKSVLQYMTTRPLSAAERVVVNHANRIRAERELAKQRAEEEQTAIARKMKEEFEAAANRPLPIPDGFIYPKGQSQVTEETKAPARMATLRMYLKTPEFKDRELELEEDQFALRLNPMLPKKIFSRRMLKKNVFPK
jgi:hypothetical protein